jgi:hypothetical protein
MNHSVVQQLPSTERPDLLLAELSTAKIASACRISKRCIHMIFADLDETVGRYILRRRLEASALALTSEEPCRR